MGIKSPGYGRVGPAGRDGKDGQPGPRGEKGERGDVGPASTVPGPKGDKGEPGAASTVPGPKGDKGDRGDTGAASTVPGPKGDKGDTGAQGKAGVDAEMPRRAILTYAGSDLTWTYPAAFPAGVVPVVEAVAVAPAAGTALVNVQIVGDPTNTSCKLRVNSIPAASVSLLGLVNLNLFQQAPAGVKIHVTARTP